jgi:5-methylcytosine-specific restriction endonuclease McrA
MKFNEDDFQAYFQRLMQNPVHRKAYLASRAWQIRRQALALRSNGKCERCGFGRYQVAHHLTYLHFGAEYLTELQAICWDCHKYLHAKSNYDPCKDRPIDLQRVLDFEQAK